MELMDKNLEKIKEEIFEKMVEYYEIKKKNAFIPGKDRINYAGAVFSSKEAISMTDSILKGWFGLGQKGRELDERLSHYLGVSRSILVNSGSSANLLSLAALKSNTIDNHLKNEDEIITPAVTFPTTFNPIIQNNLTPVVVDVDTETYNINIEGLKGAVTRKTKGIMLPHTLGNPNDMDAIMDIVEDHKLYLIEDNCDALGSEFDGRRTGSYGILSTCSFYPAHHITMGEGGSISVVEDNIKLYRVIRSLRDWGRDCWCESDNKSSNGACNRRFEWEIDDTKYDHRYIYSQVGYNLKPTEIQAAFGLEQIKRIEEFNEIRKRNFQYLHTNLRNFEEYISFIKIHKKANPAWFAFPILINEDSPFSRDDTIRYLEGKGIQTRLIFAGNITKQPAYKDVKYKVHRSLENAESIMKRSFFIGVYPGLDELMLNYIVESFNSFFEGVR
ncbi:MAG: lipopolysaccharide biosynthesis protein RfbH [Halobacteriota archaeon]|nr:lipopolysaccharide biosynthesis protein RfbH [Halobacteriota archaeon]